MKRNVKLSTLILVILVNTVVFAGGSRVSRKNGRGLASEPVHPILQIPRKNGADAVLKMWSESEYIKRCIPKYAPRSNGPVVVPGDTNWSWNKSNPDKLTSVPSGTIFPNTAYTTYTSAVTVMNDNVVNAPYYLAAGSTSKKSLVYNYISYKQVVQLRRDLAALSYAYIKSGNRPSTRNDIYARRIAVALLQWAKYFPDYIVTKKNSTVFVNTGSSYILSSDMQRGSDHNGLAHEWSHVELRAFDAIYDSIALADLSKEKGFDVREYIKKNIFFDEGDFIVDHVPVSVAIRSNLSGPYIILPMVARVLNNPRYIKWMSEYLSETVRKKINRNGVLSEGLSYSFFYNRANIKAAQNTSDYFLTRPANTQEFMDLKITIKWYVDQLNSGITELGKIALPNGKLPSFGDTVHHRLFSARNAGNSALLPSYGSVALGAGSGKKAVQLNQNFSGDANHMRSDTTAFVLWAFGNEVLGNVRYHHSAGRQFTEQILAYNAVTIDRTDMASPSFRTYGNGNITLYEPGNNGLALTEIDGQHAYKNKASRYQRIMMLNTLNLSRPYVVDVMRVTGGTTHDYVFHGPIQYDCTYECSFPLIADPSPYPMLEDGEYWFEPAGKYSRFPYYGFWRNVSSNIAPGDFQITYHDSSGSGCDVRLWMTDDATAQVYIGTTPVPARKNSTPENWWVNGIVRPSSIIRKRSFSGPLESLFVSVIEPINSRRANRIKKIERIATNGNSLESCALRVVFTDGRTDTYLVNLHNMQVAGADTGSPRISTADGKYALDGRIGLYSNIGRGKNKAWLVNAERFQYKNQRFIAKKTMYYSGVINSETRKFSGDENDAFVTTTPLPLGTALQGEHILLTFGALPGYEDKNISEMFEIDHVLFSNGQYHICLTRDHMLEMTDNTTVEQAAPLRTFIGTNSFEIALSTMMLQSSAQ